MPRKVAIFIFPEVEILDFCGPYEVFSVSGRQQSPKPFQVYTVAQSEGPVVTANGLSVNPDHLLDNCPPADVLVIPGGMGTRKLLHEPGVIDWIRQTAGTAEIVFSVCTGALLLAQAGLLEGQKATTHHGALDLLAELAPGATLEPGARFIDNGKVVAAAGISAGIDASLHLVQRLLGMAVAREAAAYMEYRWQAE